MKLPHKILRYTFGERLPRHEGEVAIDGLRRSVCIRRDRFAVPHIEAATDEDAWFAYGFCQGQDRTFQLELFLRVCRGTLAALIGKRGLAPDRLSRRIGMARDTREQLDLQPPAARAQLQAFADGVNAGAEQGLGCAPHELALLGRERTPWTAHDVVAMVRFVGFTQSMSWDAQLVRLQILDRDGPAALAALEPEYASHHPINTRPGAAAGAAIDRLSGELEAFCRVTGHGGASNNWAIGVDRTRTGRPLLANDPHLDPSMPCQWYLAHLETPQWAAAGAGFVGAPGIIVGHNGFGAWGATNAKADGAHVVLERLGADGRSVVIDGETIPCRVVDERIEVRGGAAVTERVLLTPHGPIVGPAVGIGRDAVALHASWLQRLEIDGFLSVHRARGWGSFRRCFEKWPSAQLNIVYADADDVIGWQMVGSTPRRRDGAGYLPAIGDQPGGPFDSDVPFAEMPSFTGGRESFVATANNRPHPDPELPFLGVNWTAGYRAARIYEQISGRDDWDVESCMRLQADVLSLPWRELRSLLMSLAPRHPGARAARRLLEEWNGELTADSPGAAVFAVFLHEMSGRICRAAAPRTWEWALGKGINQISPFNAYTVTRLCHTVEAMKAQPPGVFPRGWTEEMERALAAAAAGLTRRRGPDPRAWAWGAVRPLTLAHPLGKLPGMGRIFDIGPFPWGGDTSTVGMCTSDGNDVFGQPQIMASMRMVVEIGKWDEARFVLHGGQSGNPLSPHYADQHPLWRRHDALRLAFSKEAVQAETVHTLRLRPAAGAAPAVAARSSRARQLGIVGLLRGRG